MENNPAASFDLNPDDLAQLIKSCRYASDRLTQVISPLILNGRIGQEWAHDAVSLEVAKYYDEQTFLGQYSSYAALGNYQRELVSTIATLEQIFAEYQVVDGTAAHTMENQ